MPTLTADSPTFIFPLSTSAKLGSAMIVKPSGHYIRVGLLGCGTISQFAHLPALEKARRVHLTAVCDAAEDLLTTVSNRWGIQHRFTDYGMFLADAPIDAVLIAAPDPFHVPLAEQALKAGKHVLVEKPLGSSVKECRTLVQCVDSTGLKLQVGCMKRHDPGIAFAQRFIEERLDSIFSVHGFYFDSSLRPILQEALLPPVLTSANTLKPSVDPKSDRTRYDLVTHGAHLFDNLRYLGGGISALTARMAELRGQHSWHGIVEFSKGGIGSFELTVKIDGGWVEGYTIHGPGGSVEIRTFLPFYRRSSEVRAFDAKTGTYETPFAGDSDPFKNQLESFATAILEDSPVNPDAREGLAAVAALEAVERAVQSGERVGLETVD